MSGAIWRNGVKCVGSTLVVSMVVVIGKLDGSKESIPTLCNGVECVGSEIRVLPT